MIYINLIFFALQRTLQHEVNQNRYDYVSIMTRKIGNVGKYELWQSVLFYNNQSLNARYMLSKDGNIYKGIAAIY